MEYKIFVDWNIPKKVFIKTYTHTPEEFKDAGRFFKTRGFYYDKEHRAFYMKPHKFVSNGLLDYFKYEIEGHVSLSQAVERFILKNATIDPETVFKRVKYREDLTLYKPKWNFQREDIKRMIGQNRMFNANDMGLGKTFESIASLNHWYADKKIDRVFIVCPNNVIYNWEDELLKFSAFFEEDEIFVATKDTRHILDDASLFKPRKFNPLIKRIERDEKARKLKGDSLMKKTLLKRKEAFDKGDFDKAFVDFNRIKVFICSYPTLVTILEYYMLLANNKGDVRNIDKPLLPLERWIEDSRAMFIGDESHILANRKNGYFNAVKNMIDHFYYRHLLSFTPYPKDISQFWSQMFLLDKSILGDSYSTFFDYITIKKFEYGRMIPVGFDADRIKEFDKKIAPLFIRRYKNQEEELKGKLPGFRIQPIIIKPTDKHKRLYQQIASLRLKRLKEGKGGVLVPYDIKNSFPYLLLSLSDIACVKEKFVSDTLAGKELISEIQKWSIADNSKTPYLNAIMEEEENKDEKTVIWTTHPDTAEALYEYLTKVKKLSAMVLHGKTKKETGYKDIHKFRYDKVMEFRKNDTRVAIISPEILSAGINIPEAPVNIWWDRNFKADQYIQGQGRSHRATSVKDVRVYVLMIQNTLEMAQNFIIENRVDLNKCNLFRKEAISKEELQILLNGKTHDIQTLDWTEKIE